MTDIAACLPEGRVLVDRAYQLRRRVWNGAIERAPSVIVRPESTAEVAATVRAARQVGVPISVRGGGHDWAGRAVRDGALMIDLGGMRSVEIVGDRARVGGGAIADDLLATAAEHGLTAALGTASSVGVVGLILGGGYGPLIGVAGLGVDSLLSAEVVLADGSVIIADHQREPDLFWALRGGGGNFGVVTHIETRLHRLPGITAGTIAFSWSEASRILCGLRQIQGELDDALTVRFGALHTADGPVLFTNPVWAGPSDEAGPQMARIRALGQPVTDDIAGRRLIDMARATADAFPAGVKYSLGSRIVAKLDETLIQIFTAAVAEMPAACALNVHHSHGAATRVPVEATAHAYREPHLLVEVLGMWNDGDGSAERAWVRDTQQRLDVVALPGGWTNLMAPDDPRARDAYGPNKARLLDVKARYDCDNVFTATPLP